MSDNLFPPGVSKDNQKRVLDLASRVFNKDHSNLTKDDLYTVIKMDMATFPSKMSVSASATRATQIKYSTNNYFASIELDLSKMQQVMEEKLANFDKGELLEKYLELKANIFELIRVKHEGTENYLRSLLDEAMKKDGCPVIGRNE